MIDQSITLPVSEQPFKMSDLELSRISKLIYSECGIILGPAKKSMVVARLTKRLRALGIRSFAEYYEYVNTPKGRNEELVPMIDVITTNTTEFFRERKHFGFLTETALPKLVECGVLGRTGHVNIWSAGCSTGEEPYSLAMVLADYFETHHGSFTIFATDISSRALQAATRAVYSDEAIIGVPQELRRKYLMRGTGSQVGRWRIVPELRARVILSRLNFTDSEFDLPSPIHIIFCRNVIIYFDMETKVELIRKFHGHLVAGGYYFTGHSETLSGLSDQFVTAGPTVYRKQAKDNEHTIR